LTTYIAVTKKIRAITIKRTNVFANILPIPVFKAGIDKINITKVKIAATLSEVLSGNLAGCPGAAKPSTEEFEGLEEAIVSNTWRTAVSAGLPVESVCKEEITSPTIFKAWFILSSGLPTREEKS
jgi:hypothetical protein